MHVIAAKAVAFQEALSPSFKVYQERILANAKALAKGFSNRKYHVVSGGTDTHLFLMNLTSKGVTGKEAEMALDAAGIILNKNTVPNDERSPAITSGVRVGTPIVTTRGMGTKEMSQIVAWIDEVLQHHENRRIQRRIAKEVKALCSRFPIFQTSPLTSA